VHDHHRRAENDPASTPLVKCAQDIANELRGQMVRVSTDLANHPVKAKIKDAQHALPHESRHRRP
jgi:threonyl-tRNA synthetase